MYTIRPDRPVNPVLLDILAAVQAVTQALGCPYLLVGATARDMLMTHVFGLDSRRATHDVDFAIALESWDQFQALKAALMASGDITPAGDKVHLLHYKSAEHGRAFPLDLIPFGGVEQDAHRSYRFHRLPRSSCWLGTTGGCKTTRMRKTSFSF